MERKKDLGDRSGRSRTRTKWRDDRERIRLMENDLERWMPMTAVILTAEQHAQVRSVHLGGVKGSTGLGLTASVHHTLFTDDST